MDRITYVFTRDRSKKLFSKKYESLDFFYGCQYFLDKKDFKLNIIEFNENDQNKSLLYYFDRFFQKFLSLPFYTAKINSIKNLKILSSSNKIIFVNESTACSSIFLLLYVKLFFKIETHMFVMGLYSKTLNYPSLKILHNFVIRFLCLFIDKIYFLGLGELKKAKTIHSKNQNKLISFPFHIDTNFWEKQNQYEPKYILFVGNDGNRDPKQFISAVKTLKNEKFVAVSDLKEFKNVNEENFTLYSTEINGRKLSDLELKNIYADSKLVVIPLKQSYQPSGQSVALQAMSMKVPVLITKTEGFWDPFNFKDNKNIFFSTGNSQKEFNEKIRNLISNDKLLNKIAINGNQTVKKLLSIDTLNKKIEDLII